MYLCDNVVSKCYQTLLKYFAAQGDFSEKRVYRTDDELYMSHNDDFDIQKEHLQTFYNAGMDTSFLFPIFIVQDPRILSLFDKTFIPGKVRLRSDKESYITMRFNKETDTFTAKRFYLDKLMEECEFDDAYVLRHEYFGHNKNSSRVMKRISYVNGIMEYEVRYPKLAKSESDRVQVNVEERQVTFTKRRNSGDDKIVITHKYEFHRMLTLILTVPEFTYEEFEKGMSSFYNFLGKNREAYYKLPSKGQ